MKVKELIKDLKEFPQNLKVAHHDNCEEEWVCYAFHFQKIKFDIDEVYEVKMFKDMPWQKGIS